ncbi:hypothetical protein [Kutzneria sp. CA-103260]|uniref:hypothetical protein n=1 Tax=Kutzneria sp. CA-103260 TaxID=2802641 RepID=UPI001BAB27C3|nr:hypothetical protein [Kutzneria sp. CA-103260]QUQ64606.1 WD domain, G-beta repeat [Kutzneria sp. CA-103260]
MDEEPPLDQHAWAQLDFAGDVTSLVDQAFSDLRYRVAVLRDPDRTSMVEAIGTELGQDESCLVVHVVSHGEAGDDDNRLDVVPACGHTGLGTNVSDWVSTAQQRRTPVLFLLDLCKSGRVARLPWLTSRAGRDAHAWVIASAGPEEDAFDGRFSRAVASVLSQLAKDGLGTDASVRFVSFSTLARRIAERVEAMPGVPQRVHATPLDPAQREPDLPFFPNPLFVNDPQRQARQAIDAPLRAFLDELDDVFDADHFLGRVGSHFAGRRRQLRSLARWMDGNVPTRGLRVVTGSPGVGKSALLGALVCSAHPVLTEAVPHVRDRLEESSRPMRNDHLGAVHARQRRVDELISSLARQFALPHAEQGQTISTLIRDLADLSTTPVIVVDAVDESLDPQRVLNDFLLPLAMARRLDDSPICRLLVGFRPWQAFEKLRGMAAGAGELMNLDQVSRRQLRADLNEYLHAKLADLPGYAGPEQRNVRRRLVTTVADRLVGSKPVATDTPEWGPFLVAGMFARYLENVPAATTAATAAELGSTVPCSLPEVLELELSTRPDRTALRATLAALAYAKGEGMPAEVVGLVAAGFSASTGGASTLAQLDAARFYLRTTVERDGTTLYRLLHQSLADYLRRHPMTAGAQATEAASGIPSQAGLVLERILDAVHGGLWGRWASVPLYLRRHALHHAIEADRMDDLLADVEFLVHADTLSLLPELSRAKSASARLNAEVYSGAFEHWAFRSADFDTRRWILAIEAARRGAHELSRRTVGEAPTSEWIPRWSATFPFDDAGWVTATACTGIDGELLIAGTSGLVWRRNLRSGTDIGVLAGHNGHVSTVATTRVGGKQLVVTGGADGVVRTWDLTSETVKNSAQPGTGWINAIGCANVGRRPVAVVCGDHSIRLWDVLDGEAVDTAIGWQRWTRAIACVGLGVTPVAVTVNNDHAVRVWDLTTGTLICPPMRDHRDRVYAVACTTIHGLPVAVTGGDDDAVRLWDLTTGRPHGKPLVGHTGWIAGVACAEIDGRPVAFSGGCDRTVRVWDLVTGTCREVLVMPAEVHALAVAPDGGLVVCTGQDVIVFDQLAQGRA